MTLYSYKAITKEGALQKGLLEAPSPKALKRQLHTLGYSLISYSISLSFFFSQKKRRRLLMDFCLHLQQFYRAGVPLEESLKEISHSHNSSKFQAIVKDILNQVKCGDVLSQALEKHPSLFDSVIVGSIGAAETSGQLVSILEHLFQHLKWREDIEAQKAKALRYPIFMGAFLSLGLLYLMIQLVPELSHFLKTFSETLPLSTQILISCSEVISSHFISLFIWGSGLVSLFVLLFRIHPKHKYWWGVFLETNPLFGPLYQKMVLVHFCHIFTLLYESGIDILQVLQTTQKSLATGRLSGALQDVESYVREGHNLSQAFQKTGLFPPFIIHMIKMGEASSSLPETFRYIQDYLDALLKREVEKRLSLLEPILVLILGLVLGWIVFSIFLPLYDTLSCLE